MLKTNTVTGWLVGAVISVDTLQILRVKTMYSPCLFMSLVFVIVLIQ